MNINEIAEQLVQDIFSIDSTQREPTTRLQFMSGEYPDNEKNQGGMNRDALTKQIRNSLSKIF